MIAGLKQVAQEANERVTCQHLDVWEKWGRWAIETQQPFSAVGTVGVKVASLAR